MSTKDAPIAVEDLLTLFQLTPDLVCIAGKDGYFRNFSPAVSQTLGYTREELFARPISDFIHPDDRELTSAHRTKLLKGQTLLNFQNRYVTKNGDVVWLEWTSVYVKDKEVVFAIAKNITPRKLMEQQVQDEYHSLRQRSARFKHELEKDKKYLAMELHEELAQLATSIRVDLDWLGSNGAATEKFRQRTEHALVSADLLIDTVRRISFSISPGMLDDLGLDATLEWYCSQFAISNEIECNYESNFDVTLLSKEVALDFFRICQEALNDAKLLTRATKVNVCIAQKENNVILKIEDNGALVVERLQGKSGVLSMEERAASIGAIFWRNNEPGKGTIVEITWKSL